MINLEGGVVGDGWVVVFGVILIFGFGWDVVLGVILIFGFGWMLGGYVGLWGF